MIELKINGQRLKSNDPFIVEDSVNYIQVKASFSKDWEGTDKWITFEKDGEAYKIDFDADNEIKKERGINLGSGTYKVYVHGHIVKNGELVERITTNMINIEVIRTGTLEGEPFPEVSGSVGEKYVEEMKKLLEEAGNRPCVLG
ncbi:MAG: hypothetical protein KBT03_11905 [Bacteroidales bacterium]|nr:hypothetical protein [Candidatus Scybalousia scybalohippi]